MGRQVEDTLEIIKWAVTELGMQWDDLVQARTYVVGDSEKLTEAMSALKSSLPVGSTGSPVGVACTVVGVTVLGRPEVVVEIEARAVTDRR